MELHKDGQIFFGCKVDSKMREALSQARPGDKKYFEGDGNEYLQICSAGEERWIGKLLKCGINSAEIEDIQRNIVSILRRISPTIRIAASAIKVYSAQLEEAIVEPQPKPAPNSDGPYIDY